MPSNFSGAYRDTLIQLVPKRSSAWHSSNAEESLKWAKFKKAKREEEMLVDLSLLAVSNMASRPINGCLR